MVAAANAQLIDVTPPSVTPPAVTSPSITAPAVKPVEAGAGGASPQPASSGPANPTAPASSAGQTAGAAPATGAPNNAPNSQIPLPSFDPGSETVTWNGKMWNITNNRIFRARFEKYLAAPESPAAEDAAYRQILQEINDAIHPAKTGGRPDLPKAVALLPRASQFPIDAKMCDALAEVIYSVWLARKNNGALDATNREIEKEVDRLRGNWDVATTRSDLHDKVRPGGGVKPRQQPSSQQNKSQPTGQNVNINIGPGGNPVPGGQTGPGSGSKSDAADPKNLSNGGANAADLFANKFGKLAGYARRMAELEARRAANLAKKEVSDLESKVQYQALMLQFLLQRRFEHVVMSTRIYRVLFGDGDTVIKTQEGSQLEKALNQGLGFNPTLGNLDAMANEAIRDVDEALQAFDYLAGRGDLETASKRLSEAFMIGEYLPRMRTLPRSKKEKVLDFVRDSNQLISAIEVKDYTLAEQLVRKLRETARDFDSSKPTAGIETARTVSGMHINRARVAATQSDAAIVSEELRKATEIWPNNPELKSVSAMIFNRGDAQAQALNDLDTLIGQKNYRQIFLDQAKFIAAVAGRPDYEAKLKPVLEQMNKVQMVLVQSEKLAETGDRFGAWEAVELMRKEFPGDPEISSRRAAFSAQVSELASALSRAEQHEQQKQTGSGLAWFLKARKIYPQSRFAKEGIDRLAAEVLPDGQ